MRKRLVSVPVSVSLPVSTFALVAGLALLSVPSAQAQNYHPLDEGLHWEYASTVDGTMHVTMMDDRDVFGTETRIRLQEEEAQTYENYWTSDTSGNLFLHGAYNYDGFGFLFDPPIQLVSAPLFLGKAWTTDGIQTFDLDGNPSGSEPFDYPMRVYTEGTETVPAGDFYGYGVGFDFGATLRFSANGSTYDVFGRRVENTEERGGSATDWYAENVGVVIYSALADPETGFRLVSYDSPVPVQPMSWGVIRSLFR
ncbi:MAG: hypothetical protein R3E97_05685 [Candidatus Eisenbacteria bacterium]